MIRNRFSSLFFAGCAGVVLVSGCSDKAENNVAVPSKPTAAPGQVAIGVTPQAAAAPVVAPPGAGGSTAASAAPVTTAIAGTELSADTQQALDQLNNILHGTFLAEIGRAPKSVNEFVECGLVRQLPKAPDGKKFFYDAAKKQIVLADRLPGETDPAPLTAEQAQQAYMRTMAEIHKRIGGGN